MQPETRSEMSRGRAGAPVTIHRKVPAFSPYPLLFPPDSVPFVRRRVEDHGLRECAAEEGPRKQDQAGKERRRWYRPRARIMG
jgi:hypothetical protein